jgi:hypothetical protein
MGEFLLRPQLIDSGVVTVSVEVDTEGSVLRPLWIAIVVPGGRRSAWRGKVVDR